MKLVVGLGNPGANYRQTRHNIGFMILAELAGRYVNGKPKNKFHGELLEVGIRDEAVLLLCPSTYMNRSGVSVSEAVRFYKIPFDEVLIVCDDLNLPFSKLRIRADGSAGGQKGLLDVARMLGTEAFPRLRFGIGRPPGMMDAADYVLARFVEEEWKQLPSALKRAADAVEAWIVYGTAEAMNRFNGQ
ncbi:MAG TPA: aminoacyl-tRNA hydrolase [Planctomycetaceae bacterium]|nr:aminoacyl-tRNA hydrolase [Planctomycetaceae bacterium]